MKLRYGTIVVVALMASSLLAAGCGSSKDDSKKDGKTTTAEKASQSKRDALDKSKAAFKKDRTVDNCRNVAMNYIAVASPEAPKNPKDAPKLPKDRDKNLKNAVSTLEECVKIDKANRDVKQMLASTYMATGKYQKAADLLEDIARTAKGQERANAFYAWGLAASNASDYKSAVSAWQTFASLAPRNDPRVKQVRQSIKALSAAAKATPPVKTESSSDSKKEDKGK